MKTFLLVGGDINSADDAKQSFYSFLTRDLQRDVLVIAFARDESEWTTIQKSTEDELAPYGFDNNVILASTDTESFKKQVENSGTIIIRGGSTDKLINKLRLLGFSGLNLDEKIISGSSAGAYALAKSYYSLTDRIVKDGLGLIDCNVIVHYGSASYENINWSHAVSSLGNDRPTYLIPEQTFCVISE